MTRMNQTTNAQHDLYRAFAQKVRLETLHMIKRAGSSHIGSSYSMTDILSVLYNGVLDISPERLKDPTRDRFVLSKGHACAGLYVTLAEKGFFPKEWLETFYQDGSPLLGHVCHATVPGIEVSSGALGHGLSIACGMALAGQGDPAFRVFALLSDGECDEGSIWEAALFASHHKLNNLTIIIDYNKIQSLGRVEDVLNLEPFTTKWEAFGWSVREVDGHDVAELEGALTTLPHNNDKPTCIIAHTVKGKGVHFMEDDLLWHYRCPDSNEYPRAIMELETTRA
jgi:transketolase